MISGIAVYKPRVANGNNNGQFFDILPIIFNSRTAIAEAIIGLLLVFFYFVVMIFVTTI